jgi:alkylhydroperoxidase family enzyme
MARIQGVPQDQAGPIVKLVYRFVRRGLKKMTGREAARGSGIEPVEIWALQPKIMSGMGKFQQAVRKANTVDERLKYLVELKGSQMIGCEYCLDLGSQICRNSGFSDQELLATTRHRQSDLFARMKEHFSDEQLVEITALLTVVNLDRFNAAFDVGSSGFSEGMVCVPPDRPVVLTEAGSSR